jgi:Flp pilus assembly protein TadD
MRSLLLPVVLLAAACLPRHAVHPEAVRHNNLCYLSLTSQDCKAAEAHCEHALEFSQDYAEAHVNKGLIAWSCHGDKERARESFITALRIDKESAQAYNNLGQLDLEDKRYTPAERYFRRALEVNPNYQEARWNLARLCKLDNRPEEAEKQLRQLLAVDATLADAQDMLGIVRLEAGDLDEAITRFDAAVLLVPDHPGYRFNRGVAYARAGRLEEAKEEFRACLTLKPDSAECRHNLDVLTQGS